VKPDKLVETATALASSFADIFVNVERGTVVARGHNKEWTTRRFLDSCGSVKPFKRGGHASRTRGVQCCGFRNICLLRAQGKCPEKP